MKAFFLRTFGCQMNVHDSERMAGLLLAAGFTRAEEPGAADLIIINTCSVRAKPEHKALSEAGRYKHLRHQKGTRVILAGCVAQQHGAELIKRSSFIDGVLGPDELDRLPELAASLLEGRGPMVATEAHRIDDPRFVTLGPTPKAIARYVTVMKGCDNFCAYCIVPFVRGREVCRPVVDILEEVAELGRRGVREVNLLGQNVNSYRDPDSGADFANLLAKLDAQGVMERLRFTTSHPKDLSDALIQVMAEAPSVCEHLHLALQAGSNRVLEAMRRGYTREHFLERVARLRRAVPGISLTTDLIVGFPGETEEDFAQTLKAVTEAAFDGAFSFKYSPRPGTWAAKHLEDDVLDPVKQERLVRLQVLLSELEKASLNAYVGRKVEVMVEGPSQRDVRQLTGRSRCNRVINFESTSDLQAGELHHVEIVEARGHTLFAKSS